MTTLSDSRLLQRMGNGDIASFEKLFHRHYDRVYGLLFRLVGNRVEAEDLAQEVFLKLYQQPLTAGDNVGGWLYRVATNMGYNALRSRKRRWQRDTTLLPDPTDSPVDPADRVAAQETADQVRQVLAQLPERQVQLLLLRQMELSYAEIADACGVAPGSVGTMLARAAQAFRQLYDAQQQRRADNP